MFLLLFSISFSDPQKERILDQDTTSVLSYRPNTIWRHAANVSFFKGNAQQLHYSHTNISNTLGYTSIAGPFGFGLSYQKSEEEVWWNTATSISIPLSSKIGAGFVWGWHSPNRATEILNPFHTLDLSLSFRPNQYIGFSAGTRNMGSLNPSVEQEYYSGVGLRGLSGAISIGADWTIINEEHFYTGSLILQPLAGVEVRAQGDSLGTWGAGLYLKGNLGYFGANYTPEQLQFSFVNKTPQQDLRLSKNRVASFSLDRSYPYINRLEIFGSQKETFLSLLHRIHQASLSEDLKAIIIRTGQLSLSYPQMEEIAFELNNARNTGKEVVLYIENDLDTRTYLLASHANKILLHPAANFSVVGISSERMYLRGFLDLIGITPEFVRRSAYKSSPEQYTHTQSSPASQEQNHELLTSIFDHMVQTIAQNRKINVQKVKNLIDKAPYSAVQAKSLGLIDDLHYPDELVRLIDDWFDEPNIIDDYGTEDNSDGWGIHPEIAVLYANGVIVSGPTQAPGIFGGSTMVGAETLIAQIERSMSRKNVKAVVLRVDSPGGSAFASEEIWRALMRLKAKKPLIISMGGVAASGGYYIASAGDTIFAEPTTITGSIGVFSGHFHFEKLYDIFGINVEHTSIGNHAGIYTKTQAWTPSEREKMEEMVEDTYLLFKKRVAEGRNLSPEEVEQVAQGRVWSGTASKEQKLVDELGGLYEAILHAKLKAGIKSTAKVKLITLRSGDSQSLPLISGIQLAAAQINQQQSLIHDELQKVQALKRERIWMIMPYFISLQ
jgi:protease-4